MMKQFVKKFDMSTTTEAEHLILGLDMAIYTDTQGYNVTNTVEPVGECEFELKIGPTVTFMTFKTINQCRRYLMDNFNILGLTVHQFNTLIDSTIEEPDWVRDYE